MKYILYRNGELKNIKSPDLPAAEYSIEKQSNGIVAFLKKKTTLSEFMFWLLSFGKCKSYSVISLKDGSIIHKSVTVGCNIKFPFLKRKDYEIGPCHTNPEYRGKGLYPYILQYIVRDLSSHNNFYILIREDNLSSRRGVEKAGFTEIGTVYKHHGRWVRNS